MGVVFNPAFAFAVTAGVFAAELCEPADAEQHDRVPWRAAAQQEHAAALAAAPPGLLEGAAAVQPVRAAAATADVRYVDQPREERKV